MFFSVVIPTHRRPDLLNKLLQSLTEQSFKDFEVRVVPTENDPGFELSAQYWPFPIAFESVVDDPSGGRSASVKRNFGAEKAQGEWIAFIDDDCVASAQWLQAAHHKIQNQSIQFLEGAVHIPKPERPTFPYKGIQRLSRPGGYQTCNMFYRRSDFLELGGFDLFFPYYLEDTDLAWTFLENGRQSAFAEEAIVSHPVPEPVPKKMLESAWRMEKMPHLFKKHPQTFRASNMRVLPRPYVILLMFDLSLVLSLFYNPVWALISLVLKLIVSGMFLARMLRACYWQWGEMLAMYYYLQISPLVSFLALMKGNFREGTGLFFALISGLTGGRGDFPQSFGSPHTPLGGAQLLLCRHHPCGVNASRLPEPHPMGCGDSQKTAGNHGVLALAAEEPGKEWDA